MNSAESKPLEPFCPLCDGKLVAGAYKDAGPSGRGFWTCVSCQTDFDHQYINGFMRGISRAQPQESHQTQNLKPMNVSSLLNVIEYNGQDPEDLGPSAIRTIVIQSHPERSDWVVLIGPTYELTLSGAQLISAAQNATNTGKQ